MAWALSMKGCREGKREGAVSRGAPPAGHTHLRPAGFKSRTETSGWRRLLIKEGPGLRGEALTQQLQIARGWTGGRGLQQGWGGASRGWTQQAPSTACPQGTAGTGCVLLGPCWDSFPEGTAAFWGTFLGQFGALGPAPPALGAAGGAAPASGAMPPAPCTALTAGIPPGWFLLRLPPHPALPEPSPPPPRPRPRTSTTIHSV